MNPDTDLEDAILEWQECGLSVDLTASPSKANPTWSREVWTQYTATFCAQAKAKGIGWLREDFVDLVVKFGREIEKR